MPGMDEVIACSDLIAHARGRAFEIGYLHDGVPSQRAAWWAHAQYRGHRLIIEGRPGPAEAADALARLLLDSAECQVCGGLVTLTGMVRPGQCRWRRAGPRWAGACQEVRAGG
jgi:hypothetical protein